MEKTTLVRVVVCGLPLILSAACSDSSTVTEPVRPVVAVVEPALGQTIRVLGVGKYNVHIVSATGDINSAVGDFRHLLGDGITLGVPGEQSQGHREINWDGVPAAVTNTNTFPGTFFNVNNPRGLVTTTPGSGFRVGDDGYIGVNPNYDGEFVPFSGKKMFVAVGSTITDGQFFVAGSNTPAVVTGFGSVFEDVGRAHSTTIEYFDVNGNSLLKVVAPRRSDANGISFVGAVFDVPVVASVRITAGDAPLSADNLDNVKGAGQKQDLVAMDDFLYGEPHPIN